MRTQFLFFVLCLGLGTTVFAQDAQLSGTITDPDGPTLGATIKVFQNDVRIKGTVSDIDGYYQIGCLEDGEYTVEISLIGYEDTIIQKLNISSTQVNSFDAKFKPSIKPIIGCTFYNPRSRVYEQGKTIGGLTFRADFISKHPTRIW